MSFSSVHIHVQCSHTAGLATIDGIVRRVYSRTAGPHNQTTEMAEKKPTRFMWAMAKPAVLVHIKNFVARRHAALAAQFDALS